jgi:hypothetical protein
MSAKLGHVATRHQIEPRQQRLHGGIEPIKGLELERKTFGQIARAHADGIKTVQHTQHGFDIFPFAAQAIGHIGRIGAQIAGFIHRIDQRQKDHAVFGQ